MEVAATMPEMVDAIGRLGARTAAGQSYRPIGRLHAPTPVISAFGPAGPTRFTLSIPASEEPRP